MRTELQKAISDWRNENILGIENKHVTSSRLPNGEFVISIRMEETLTFDSASTVVKETQQLVTCAQSKSGELLGGQEYPNPNGDVYRFKNLSTQLESKYWVRREEEYTRLIQKVMPDGFFDSF